MPTELQTLINELEALLRRAKERPCPGWFSAPDSHVVTCIHKEHGYSGTTTDPNLQAAWELLDEWASKTYMDTFLGDIPTTPTAELLDSMVRGLFEQLIETAKLGELQHFPDQLRRFIMPLPDGGRHTVFYENAGQLGKALKEALNERATN